MKHCAGGAAVGEELDIDAGALSYCTDGSIIGGWSGSASPAFTEARRPQFFAFGYPRPHSPEDAWNGAVDAGIGRCLPWYARCHWFRKWNAQLPLCAAIYMSGLALGTIAGCIVITQRKPLELLQVKE